MAMAAALHKEDDRCIANAGDQPRLRASAEAHAAAGRGKAGTRTSRPRRETSTPTPWRRPAQGPIAAAPCFEADLVAELATLRARATFLERSSTTAGDLVQDTLERALSNWFRFQPGTDMRRWLLAIMQNLFVDRCRKRKRSREQTASDLRRRDRTPAMVTATEWPGSPTPWPWSAS